MASDKSVDYIDRIYSYIKRYVARYRDEIRIRPLMVQTPKEVRFSLGQLVEISTDNAVKKRLLKWPELDAELMEYVVPVYVYHKLIPKMHANNISILRTRLLFGEKGIDKGMLVIVYTDLTAFHEALIHEIVHDLVNPDR